MLVWVEVKRQSSWISSGIKQWNIWIHSCQCIIFCWYGTALFLSRQNMKLRVRCDTWYIQKCFLCFANDNEISQSTEHNFESKGRDGEPREQESLCWGSARLLCRGWHRLGLAAGGTRVPQLCPNSCFQRQPVMVKPCSLQEVSPLAEHWSNGNSPASPWLVTRDTDSLQPSWKTTPSVELAPLHKRGSFSYISWWTLEMLQGLFNPIVLSE